MFLPVLLRAMAAVAD
jgi:hypothetical protein